jgi:hypothetical protein
MEPSDRSVSADMPESNAELNASKDTGPRVQHGTFSLAVAGVLGALLAGVVSVQFPPGWRYTHPGSAPPNAAEQALYRRAALLNTVSAFAVVGAVMAVCGVAGGSFSRRSWKLLCIGAPVGLLLGAAAGALGGWAGNRIQTGSVLELTDIAKSVVQQATVWCSIGLAVGCSIALTLGRLKALGNAIVAAVLGGGLSALIYVAIVAFLFPGVSTDALLPSPQVERLALFCLNGLLMGGLVGLVTTEKPSKVKNA